jgi:hypothetical protein
MNMKPKRKLRMLTLRVARKLIVAALLFVGIAFGLRWFLTPGPMPRTEISPGVFLEVRELNKPGLAEGKVMIAEIHWDTPGLEIVVRPLDENLLRDGKHYRLTSPSLRVFQENYLLLMNGTLSYPHSWYHSLPGSVISSNETVVAKGVWSHFHEHSYLIWWDAEGNGHFEESKPPSQESIAKAVNGIGVQGVAVADGQLRDSALAGPDSDRLDSQSIIGIDPKRRVLWLIAFQRASVREAAGIAIETGARFVGRLDSGDASTMIVGPSAEGVRAFSGFRHQRFLGNYLAVRESGR